MPKLVGQNYTTPDLVAKVTGKAKYAEDFRAEGMLFAKLLLSPMPHARVVRIDTSAALAIPGVKAILTVDDLPGVAAGAELGENVRASTISERGLTLEPLYEGEPILAVAAVDEYTAAEAVEAIQIEYEPLPFAVDPVASLRPGSSNARETGNVWMPPTPPAGGAAAARGGAQGAKVRGVRGHKVRRVRKLRAARVGARKRVLRKDAARTRRVVEKVRHAAEKRAARGGEAGRPRRRPGSRRRTRRTGGCGPGARRTRRWWRRRRTAGRRVEMDRRGVR